MFRFPNLVDAFVEKQVFAEKNQLWIFFEERQN